ncbi:MAG: TIR domain-containing protein [Verrucomicrobia bacterium]|nr:TIR domain-containing protein [Verrucomicrobiota bacterium]
MSDVPASTSTGAVFLSYARGDSATVLRIAEALRASGVEVWFDQNELVGGDAWDAKIRGQIATCALFVPVISANTQARLEGYFRLEWKLAANRSHTMAEERTFLLPVVIDATRDAEAKVPAEFKAVQWTRLAGAEPTPQFVERIKRLLVPAGAVGRLSPPGAGEPTGLEPRATPTSRRPTWIYAAAAIVALAAGAFFALRKPAVTDKSIAVLPFTNLGADKGDEYIGDGMSEELLNVFAKLPKLKVAARTSSFFFKGKNLPIAEVGKQLSVAFVLEGSVRRTGNKLRITAQLNSAADGYHLWSETYDRDMTDLLAIQTEVSEQVVKALLGKLGMEESRALEKRATGNPEAHRLYLLGKFHFSKSTRAAWGAAIESFEQSIRIDPAFALAYCGLADTYAWAGGNVLPGRDAWAKEKELAQKAIELEPNLADAHLSLGIALANAFEWDDGERSIKRALELNPNLALAHDQMAWLCAMLGRFDESLRHTRKTVELEPLSPMFNSGLGYYLYFARRFDESLVQLRKASALDPNFAFMRANLGLTLLYGKRDAASAAVEFRLACKLDDVPWYSTSLAQALAVLGDRAGAEEILRRFESESKQRYIGPGAFAGVYLALGNKEKFFEWLDKAFEDQDGICWNLKNDPIYESLQVDPRMRAMIKKVGLEK